jgi:hypothetical protein
MTFSSKAATTGGVSSPATGAVGTGAGGAGDACAATEPVA